ncbi:MAG: patatin-like phospholipase family protein [Bacteroides sp.]|nr:patatin-like phospholipase family protein [Bacteroides sp.]
MNKHLILFVACLLLGLQGIQAQQASGRKKVAVVLSGGGAKGSAHIGVLKAVEEAGIPIDYVVGTSMGAVVGGLYAAGYTPSQLDTLIKGQDWEFLLSDKTVRKTQTLAEREDAETYLLSVPFSGKKKPDMSGLVRGQNLGNLLSKMTIGYHDSIDFRRLPTPFACVATNIVDGKEVVFTGGKLSTAIRASMAIPGMFTPVRQDGMVLVDGGLVNNFPVDVARQLGADIVIGSTVQSDMLKAENLVNLSDILSQIVSIACKSKYEDNIADCNLHLPIDTKNYSMLDFKPEVIDAMIHQGEAAAHEHWDELLAIKREVCPDAADASCLSVRDTMTTSSPFASVPIRHVIYQNENRHEIKTIARRCRISDDSQITLAQIEGAVSLLQKEFNYPDAYYSLTDTDGKYDLTFHVTNKSQSNVKLGIRFDTEDMISAMIRGDIFFNTSLPSSLTLYGRIGQQFMGGIKYSFNPVLNKSLNLSYEFHYNDIDLDEDGDRLYNLVFRNHDVAFSLKNMDVRNFQYELGVKMEHYNYNSLLTSNKSSVDVPHPETDTYFNYFFQLKYQTQDNSYFPTKGVSLRAGYMLITDDFAHLGDGSPVSAVNASWGAAISVSRRFAILPTLAGRFLFGGEAPAVYSNVIGGHYAAKYRPQQLPFIGINSMEYAYNSLAMASLKLRQRMGSSHYLTLAGSAAVSADHIEDLNDGRFCYGVGLEYGYNTKFGPMEASLGYYNRSDKPQLLISLGYYF